MTVDYCYQSGKTRSCCNNKKLKSQWLERTGFIFLFKLYVPHGVATVSNVANCWGRKQNHSGGSCISNQMLPAGGGPVSLPRISYVATLDHLEARKCHFAMCLESRGQALLANNSYDRHSFCCHYASALSLSGLNFLAAGCHCWLRRTADFWERLQEAGAWVCLGVQEAEQKALFSYCMSIWATEPSVI